MDRKSGINREDVESGNAGRYAGCYKPAGLVQVCCREWGIPR